MKTSGLRMHALDQGPTQRPYLPQPVDDNDLIGEGRKEKDDDGD